MHAEDRGSPLSAEACERQPGPEPLSRILCSGNPAKEGFPGKADQKRALEFQKGGQPGEQPPVMLPKFSKSDSWVEGDAHRVNPAFYRPLHGLSKKIPISAITSS